MRIALDITFIVITLLFISACTNEEPPLPNSPIFKQGVEDGCTTSKGDYRKNSELFRNNAQYQDGWFYGRRHCNI